MNKPTISYRKSLKLSKLTDKQLQIKFDLNVQKEAWSELELSRNPIIRSLAIIIESDIEKTEKRLARNMAKCAKIVQPLKVIR